MPDLPTRLARKYSRNTAWVEDAIAAAICEALKEAEKIANHQAKIWNPDEYPSGFQASRYIAAAMRALREGE